MLDAINPYLAVINAVLTTGLLVFVIQLAGVIRQAERSRADNLEERLNGAKEELARHEKWAQREKENLTAENDRLRTEMDALLASKGLTIETLAIGRGLGQDPQTSQRLDEILNRLEALPPSVSDDPEEDLEISKAYAAQGRWREAAERLDQYVKSSPASFDVQFLRGVAWANTREGDLNALSAYNEAVTLAPSDSSKPAAIRPLVYRGAILKRLGRLEEARNDLVLALNRLNDMGNSYEADDARYNLACVAAMRGDGNEMMTNLRSITRVGQYRSAVLLHLDDYFERFAGDARLLDWLNPLSGTLSS